MTAHGTTEIDPGPFLFLLLERARALGVHTEDVQAAVEAVLDAEVKVPAATEEECRRFYDRHRDRFVAGEGVLARHILFAVTDGGPIDTVRRQAEHTLKDVTAHPERFGDVAAKFSNCPSAEQGGSLGRLARGDAVPEFEQAVFGHDATGVLADLVRTRYGFHVVAVDRREKGNLLPFAVVHDAIARRLESLATRRALRQYVQLLASSGNTEGSNLRADESPLVQ